MYQKATAPTPTRSSLLKFMGVRTVGEPIDPRDQHRKKAQLATTQSTAAAPSRAHLFSWNSLSGDHSQDHSRKYFYSLIHSTTGRTAEQALKSKGSRRSCAVFSIPKSKMGQATASQCLFQGTCSALNSIQQTVPSRFKE